MEVDHDELIAAVLESAMRNSAYRRTSRSGSRARTNTPSARSSRRSIGGPSAYNVESTAPCSYGNKQLHELEAILEAQGDAAAKLVEPLASPRGDLSRTGKPVAQPPTRERIDGVDLVQDDLDRQLVCADLGEDAVDRADHLSSVTSGVDASTTWSTRSASRSPRASPRSPRRARVGVGE